MVPFLADVRGAIAMISLTSEDLDGVIDTASAFRLDFDDAYQLFYCRKIWPHYRQF